MRERGRFGLGVQRAVAYPPSGGDVGAGVQAGERGRRVIPGDPGELGLPLFLCAAQPAEPDEFALDQAAPDEDGPKQVAFQRGQMFLGGDRGHLAGPVGQLGVAQLGGQRVGDDQQRLRQGREDAVGGVGAQRGTPRLVELVEVFGHAVQRPAQVGGGGAGVGAGGAVAFGGLVHPPPLGVDQRSAGGPAAQPQSGGLAELPLQFVDQGHGGGGGAGQDPGALRVGGGGERVAGLDRAQHDQTGGGDQDRRE